MGRYIIFQAESAPDAVWEQMQLAHSGAMTFILAEHYDASDGPLPGAGYRLREYYRIEPFADDRLTGASTHSRVGDWEVTRVEEYESVLPNQSHTAIVLCYCRYAPIRTALEPLPDVQVTPEPAALSAS